MRSIFSKIFLSFLLTIALVGIVSFAFFYIFVRTPPEEIHRQDFIISSLSFYEQTAINILQNQGESDFREYLSNIEKNLPLKVSIYNAENKAIYKHHANTDFDKIEKQHLENFISRKKNFDVRPFENRIIVSKVVLKPDKFLFFWDVVLVRPHFHPGNANYQIFRHLGALLAIALVCYGLSRYLTSPIIKLSLATREFANGNLQVRVGKAIGKRKDELGELARDFDNMAENICALVNSQKRMISDISHELRSPLARLNVALDLARKRSGEKAFSALDRIGLESERLNQLIEQILTLAHLESDQTLSFITINLTKMVQEVAEDANFEAQNKECSVITKLNEVSVVADKNLIRSVIDNILRNAVRYTKENSKVEVFLSYQENFGKKQAVIEVQDQGDGVPERDLTEIFKPFYRVEYARERDRGGSGLGLAIVAQAVKLHKGGVTAKNLPLGGLSVSIILPLNPKEFDK